MNSILAPNLRLFAIDIIQQNSNVNMKISAVLYHAHTSTGCENLRNHESLFFMYSIWFSTLKNCVGLEFLKSDSYWISSSTKNYWMSLPRLYTTSDLMQLIQQTCICRNSIVGVTNQLINEVTYQLFWLEFLNIHRASKIPATF